MVGRNSTAVTFTPSRRNRRLNAVVSAWAGDLLVLGVRHREPWSRPVRVTRTLRNASSASPHKPYAAKPIHIWVRRAGISSAWTLALTSFIRRRPMRWWETPG